MRIEAVLRQMPAGVVIAEAPSGRILLTNDQVQHICGYTPRLVTTLAEQGPCPASHPRASHPQASHPQASHPNGQPYRPEECPLSRSLLTGEKVTNEEIVYLRPDGTRSTLLANSTPIHDREGAIMAGVVTLCDITERKQAEEDLRAANRELRIYARALDSSPDLIGVVARRYVYRLVNPAYTRMHRRLAEEIIGRTVKNYWARRYSRHCGPI
jgi:hypothetical protein